MQFFERYNNICRYSDECEEIKNYITQFGKCNFLCDNSHIEALWREFSTECFSAGFLIPSKETMNLFIDWLCEKEI